MTKHPDDGAGENVDENADATAADGSREESTENPDAGSGLPSRVTADRAAPDPVLSVRSDGRLELGVPDQPTRWLTTDAPAELDRWV